MRSKTELPFSRATNAGTPSGQDTLIALKMRKTLTAVNIISGASDSKQKTLAGIESHLPLL